MFWFVCCCFFWVDKHVYFSFFFFFLWFLKYVGWLWTDKTSWENFLLATGSNGNKLRSSSLHMTLTEESEEEDSRGLPGWWRTRTGRRSPPCTRPAPRSPGRWASFLSGSWCNGGRSCRRAREPDKCSLSLDPPSENPFPVCLKVSWRFNVTGLGEYLPSLTPAGESAAPESPESSEKRKKRPNNLRTRAETRQSPTKMNMCTW